MNFFESVVALFLGLWFILSVLGQFRSVQARYFAPFDYGVVIPQWTFFAPTPATFDYHLMYRLRFSGGELTPWSEIQVFKRRWFDFIVSSERRAKKALFDLMGELAKEIISNKGAPAQVSMNLQISVPYLFLLTIVSRHVTEKWALSDLEGTVFQYGALAFADHNYETHEQWLFMSATHRLEPRDSAEYVAGMVGKPIAELPGSI